MKTPAKLTKTGLSGLLAASAFSLFSSGAAVAAPTFGTGADGVLAPGELNSIFFKNFESLFRPINDCTVNTCILSTTLNFNPATAGVPAGWGLVNPSVADNVLVGDVFVGVFDVQNIDGSESGALWSQTLGSDLFSGYFAQQVSEIFSDGTDPNNLGANIGHMTLTNPTTDPFGILSAGESFQFYVDDGVGATDMLTTLTSYGASIASVTDGTLWATLGDGLAAPGAMIDDDGFMYSHPDFDQAGDNIALEAFFGLNFVIDNTGLKSTRINDDSENEIGGFGPFPETGFCPPFAGSIVCNDMAGNSIVTFNGQWALGLSPWTFDSNDPFKIYVVPTPGTLAMMGLGLIFLARQRRMRKA